MLFAGIANAGRAVIVLSFISLAGYSALQTVKVNNLSATNVELYQKIADLEAAQVLTEKLMKDNAALTTELNALQGELKGEVGYDTPLPNGISDVLKRVQRAGE
jgi:cell shape-determining protein MreC